MSYIIFLLSSIFGLSLNHILTHPRSKINRKLPYIIFKRVQICPYLEIKLKTKFIRVHHWMAYSILLIITITYSGNILNNVIANGYFIGAIVQGLSFPDWKQIIYKK